MKTTLIFALFLFTSISFLSCTGQEEKIENKASVAVAKTSEIESSEAVQKDNEEALITFVELGSVNCIPCKQMQPVMKSIENKYGPQINVVFHDVWEEEGKKYSKKYSIRLIPTQVFLDRTGKEIFRHEGFFPEVEIDRFLQKQGLIAVSKS
ncbi:MAG: thioredoxin [Calditrichaeota bacterium]|nr:MAG: thioredoxin [Calditrichota bacterium]